MAVLIAYIGYGLLYFRIGRDIDLHTGEAISVARKLFQCAGYCFLINIEDNYGGTIF